MSDILLLLKRTVFLPKGSPGIFSINDIKVDIRNPVIKGEDGKIYCMGDCDILLEYLSQETEKDLKRGIMMTEDIRDKNSEPRPWQALLTLPFSLVEEGERVCPPLSQLEVADVKWFVVAPRALELEIMIKLLPDQEETAEDEKAGGVDKDILDEINMEDQIYFGLDGMEKDREYAESSNVGASLMEDEVFKKGEESYISKMMKNNKYNKEELIDIESMEENEEEKEEYFVKANEEDNEEELAAAESLEENEEELAAEENVEENEEEPCEKEEVILEAGFEDEDQLNTPAGLEILKSEKTASNAEDIMIFKDNFGTDISGSQDEEIMAAAEDNQQQEAAQLEDVADMLYQPEKTVPKPVKPFLENTTRIDKTELKGTQFNMRFCRVLEGENLASVAQRTGVSPESLANRNKITDGSVKAGMYLIIPR